MQATLQPTGIAAGSVQGTIIISMKDAQPEFSWNTKGDSLDLGALIMALLAEPEARFSGLGKFSSAGTGRGQGELLRQSLDGNIVFDVTDGQFLKSPMLDFLAEQTHIDEFKKFGFKTLHGELQIKEGWMKIREMRADGPAVALEASGQFGLDGRLDLQVQPKLGPTLSQRLKIPCLDQFAKTADGFTVLPVGVTVGGTTDKPEYGATVATAGSGKQYVGALVGTVADLLTGCSGGERAQKTTEETVDVIKEKATDLMESLLGGKKKR